jgi:hypothetical protein
MLIKSYGKKITTEGVVTIDSILKDAEGDYISDKQIFALIYYNPTNYSVKVNGMTIPPKKYFRLDISQYLFTQNYNSMTCESINPLTLSFSNGKGALEITVFYYS